ncbi:MAG: hypothetical protein A2Z91_08655 [Deltaproteobacteria bacterium GWA2_38_16]|nr:MAG: hypothetical protein A2Z91_08655 [Deltaproteobacteria bacterium GWA2_38_16]OGQ03864.1 MAG: hypothetical protein A3D19_07220 [Deltaproteobacteria bacterium RIFCSPHIGHO2_02_FULL_38_15]OGQ33330.1 MAG: hypothetical protein A3A72_08505 [Deltaproteobacteria bacterium RIFCSPLOWO2_01_FULL_38_9]OGQ59732.1 MAG: hypothetical protein A3G92_03635 [Deltaproteobacteria bacterium RIFCSPLOWO2_12_FULL_38_8]HBQ20910.1 hypothetical protein [Deltaproteobacteria bacterium]
MSAALDCIKEDVISEVKLPDTIKMLKRQVVRLNTLVNDVLDVSKIESGKMMYHFKNCNFNSILSQTFEEFAQKAKELGIHLIKKMDSHLPFIRADKDKILEILSNLIGNSFKFTPRGGEIRIEAGIKEVDEEWVEIRVVDTGSGIPKDKIQNLFERFGDHASTTTQKGTGLGLYIVKSYIKAHQGDIHIESEENVKTSVVFTIPVARTPKILVVDDTKDMLALIQEELKSEGYDVQSALSGRGALDIIEKGEIPDLFLTDIHMSPMSGHELIGRLRELKTTEHIPIIAMTATDEELEWFKKNNSTIQVINKAKLLKELLPLLKEELGDVPQRDSGKEKPKPKLKKGA